MSHLTIRDNKDKIVSLEWLVAKSENDFFYLASPYSSPDKHVMEERARTIQRINAELMNAGVLTFCPIGSCHDTAVHNDLPRDHEFWLRLDRVFIEKSVGMIIATMSGWQQSRGIAEEIKYCIKTRKPIYYLAP